VTALTNPTGLAAATTYFMPQTTMPTGADNIGTLCLCYVSAADYVARGVCGRCGHRRPQLCAGLQRERLWRLLTVRSGDVQHRWRHRIRHPMHRLQRWHLQLPHHGHIRVHDMPHRCVHIPGGVCTSCFVGTYSNVASATSSGLCTACAAGTYASVATGASACTACRGGPIRRPHSGHCRVHCVCTPGTYNSLSGAATSAACTSCAAGAYSTLSTGATSCTACAVGRFSASTGASAARVPVRGGY
jgi:hypothetical protein